jgi:hypothetical protein
MRTKRVYEFWILEENLMAKLALTAAFFERITNVNTFCPNFAVV